jgi:flagellar motor switch protein FliN/FliY
MSDDPDKDNPQHNDEPSAKAPQQPDAAGPSLQDDPPVDPHSSTAQGGPADSTSASPSKDPRGGQGEAIQPQDIDMLFDQAEAALASAHQEPTDLPQGVSPFSLQDFTGAPASTQAATLDLVREVQLDVRIELGRTHMHLEDVLRLTKGAVVPLDKLAGDPVDVFVNGRLIARGEVLVLNDNFCIRITELIVGETSGS